MDLPVKEKMKKTKAELLHAAFVLFTQKGYSNTSVEEISHYIGLPNNNMFFRIFDNKEAALVELMPYVLKQQMNVASEIIEQKNDLILVYAYDLAVEHYVSEISEGLRDLYIASYSLPSTSILVYKMMAPKLALIFKDNFPDYELKDFYELDIATANIIRGYMSIKCDMYFPLKQKIKLSIQATLRVLKVPETKIDEVIEIVLKKDISDIVQDAINRLKEELNKDIEINQ